MSKRTFSETFGIPKVCLVTKMPEEEEYFNELRLCRTQRKNERAAILAAYDNTGSLFRCGKCGSDKDVTYDAQVRRAMDEGMVYECTCKKCGFRFVV